MSRLSNSKIFFFVVTFILTLFFGFVIFLQKTYPRIPSKEFKKVKFDIHHEEHKVSSDNNNHKPNIKLMNSKDIDFFNGDILIMVTSHIGFRKRRDTIRSTWGNSSRFTEYRRMFNSVTYKVYFMTGYLDSPFEDAKIESSLFKDLLITNRTENYWDFSRRVMFGFLWSLENCKYNYLLKADDDVFINIPNFLKLIYTDPFVLAHRDRILAGKIYPKNPVIRESWSKWYVSKEEWAPEFYPPFATGMGILLSRRILENMRPHFDWVKPYRLDDVYVGMLVDKANVPGIGIRVPENNHEFTWDNSPNKCNFLRDSIVFHKVNKAWCMESLTLRSIRYSPMEPYLEIFSLIVFICFFIFYIKRFK